MSIKLTKQQVIQKAYDLSTSVHTVFTRNNDSMYNLFNNISNLSTLLPSHLNNISVLSDMITDALVVTGSSSLSKSSLELKEISNSNITFNTDTNTFNLKIKNKYTIPIVNDKSYIKSDSSYLTYSADNSTLLNLKDLLNGTPILLRSSSSNYRYTFNIKFSNQVNLNALNLKLSTKTKSYPLLSELYYINKDNKKEYITILNNSKTSFNLDENRVKDNSYIFLFDNITTDQLYITLEDREDIDLILDSLSCHKYEYEAQGEIIVGPVQSTYPILKASLEAQGDTSNAEFYLSSDQSTWTRIILPTEVNKDSKTSKIVSYNTISSDSLKTEKDVKQLYLKIILNKKETNTTTNSQNIKTGTFYSSVYDYPSKDKVTVATVYKNKDNIFFGDNSYLSNYTITNDQAPQISYIVTDSIYKVRGFTTNEHSVNVKDSLNNVTIKTNYLKVSGSDVTATNINPLTANIYGYVIKDVVRTYNTLNDKDVILPLKKDYSKDIYTIRQDNKEIKIDLSLGFISSALNVIISVVKDSPVTLHDSTGKQIKELTPFTYENNEYISLIRDDLFVIPTLNTESDSFVFNDLYPLKLNTDGEYGLLDNKFICIKSLLSFKNYSVLYLEKIDTIVNLSKENTNTLKIANTEIKDKYTEYFKETVEAFSKSRAIKLRNKHIKKGSLRITQK